MFGTTVSFFRRRATTAYSRLNYTILDFEPEWLWEPVTYSPADFFAIHDSLFKFDTAQSNYRQFLDYQYFAWIWASLVANLETGTSDRRRFGLTYLEQFVSLSVAQLNNAAWGTDLPSDMGKTASVARQTYRV